MALTLGMILAGTSEGRAETKPRLAILPFSIERGEDPGRGAICPICKRVYQSGEISPGSQNTLTRLLYEKMEAIRAFEIVPVEKTEEVLSPSVRRQYEESPVPSTIRIGRELRADFIAVGHLFRFEERIGSSLGVEKPASVGFDVHLFRLRDGKEVWMGGFDETQKPLSENLFKIGSFFRRKASWLTARELASVGMGEMVKQLPGPKELEEH